MGFNSWILTQTPRRNRPSNSGRNELAYVALRSGKTNLKATYRGYIESCTPSHKNPCNPQLRTPAIRNDSQFEMATNSEWLPTHSSQFGMPLERRGVGGNSAVFQFGWQDWKMVCPLFVFEISFPELLTWCFDSNFIFKLWWSRFNDSVFAVSVFRFLPVLRHVDVFLPFA